MVRILVQYAVPILLPLAVYIAYMWWLRRRALTTGDTALPGWLEGPWYWFAVSGLVLAGAGVLVLGLLGQTGQKAGYEPARMIEGEIVPGRFGDQR